MRKLDMELQKFKLELEADNAGITERLEKSMISSLVMYLIMRVLHQWCELLSRYLLCMH